ncbi:hypothetical protein SDRG_06360 [Saprolegnia diclina VS20]|uniref:TECPR1-like DysF domain-containing protein n=1 Tax=Saprolegnia diclina (strain VS20) TaxID=1156394 RepID=T0QQR7_SAPDV|nr:hypothetical protein SDRG_06360 [Saprolegnia diclina VS20]EQC36255.1 hypothetical protein SDRG_06360 [Saprolegnia diclina VS20]|eukprot:XP_008610361.1 hypothetical protein SDRG_06360 [Saprolegnia diclina VS20]
MELDGTRYARFNKRMAHLAPLKPEVYTVEIYENQRRKGYAWHRKHLSFSTDPPPFSLHDGRPSLARFPKDLAAPSGFRWLDTWKPCTAGVPCDANGWVFGPSFDDLEGPATSGRARDADVVRRRRWARVLVAHLVPFKWKDNRLGLTLHEAVASDDVRTVSIADSTAMSPRLDLVPVGGNDVPTVLHVPKADLGLCATVSRGDVVLRIDGRPVFGLTHVDVLAQLEAASTLTLAATTRKVHILACNRSATTAGLAPNHQLVGLNERSLHRVRLLDVEILLRMAPKHSCVLYFQAATALPPDFVHVAPGIVGLETISKLGDVSCHQRGVWTRLVPSSVSSLFASSG